MEQKFCQSCGMPLTQDNLGTEANGDRSEEYCCYCYKNGAFLNDLNMSQMIEFCAQFTDQINQQAGWNLTPQQAKAQMRQYFPTLKRWKQKDTRTIVEKAAHLLTQCSEVTLASVNADGYPRPVPMSKIAATGCNDVWVATAGNSEKVTDFKTNNKAGLSYSFYGDCVALRGTVEIISDDETRRSMWQECLNDYFPGGPTDPNYVLLHFVGTEATIWTDDEFSHEPVGHKQ